MSNNTKIEIDNKKLEVNPKPNILASHDGTISKRENTINPKPITIHIKACSNKILFLLIFLKIKYKKPSEARNIANA